MSSIIIRSPDFMMSLGGKQQDEPGKMKERLAAGTGGRKG